MKTLKLIEDLSNLHGAPGFEDDVVAYVSKTMSGFKTVRDSINNVFIRRKRAVDRRPVVALDCHSDEVGFMVENINQNGTISFVPLGRWHAANVPAHAVVVKNSRGQYVKGVVASKPPHFMNIHEAGSLPELSALVIDVGSRSYDETVDFYSIEIGNPVTPDVRFIYEPGNGIMRGKAFDNRLGCAAVMSIMKDLQKADLIVEPAGVICSQEEVGLRGANVAANTIKPEFAIVFEGCPADDTFADPSRSHGCLGRGVQFRVIDAGMVSNHRVLSFARKIADEACIPYQMIARNNGQTNGARYHMAQGGIPTLVIGIPARYIHTHHSYAHYSDLENAILLGKRLLESLDATIISRF